MDRMRTNACYTSTQKHKESAVFAESQRPRLFDNLTVEGPRDDPPQSTQIQVHWPALSTQKEERKMKARKKNDGSLLTPWR